MDIMKRIWLFVLALALVACERTSKVVEFKVERHTINSTHLGHEISYSVLLPGNYERKAYPYLYLLHGVEFSDQDQLDKVWLEKGDAERILKEYVLAGGKPMIIVMPNGHTSFYIDKYDKYLHEELMPKVESQYKFNGKRAIAGLSMGGFGTTYHALKYPKEYTYAYAMSPAFENSLSSFIDKQPDKSVFPPFTFEVGQEDIIVSNDATKKLYNHMKENGIRCEFIERKGTHSWEFWKECLPKALEKVGKSF